MRAEGSSRGTDNQVGKRRLQPGLAGLALVGATACLAPPIGTPPTFVYEEVPIKVETGVRDQVDLLFVIDNSNSMAPKIKELQKRFPALITELDKLRADGLPARYHIGVVTTDLGVPTPYAPNTGCVAGGGEYGGGRLHTKAVDADARCGATTDGKQFLVVDQKTNTNNLPTPPSGEDPLAWAFGCMASVGDKGCGFEQPLEAAFQALKNPDNQDFLRPESILVVVFVTDEDDCSGLPDSDVFAALPSSPETLGKRNSFRCSRFGVVCGGQLLPYAASSSPYLDCRPATGADGAKLYDVTRYQNFFNDKNGVKADPAQQVILAAIAADPSNGVEVVLSTGSTNKDDTRPIPCDGPISDSCSPALQKACVTKIGDGSVLSGDAAVRLKAVVDSSLSHQFTSICESDYSPALKGIADKLRTALHPGCVNGVLANPEHPDCVVEEIHPDHSITQLPSCEVSGVPCWRVETDLECPGEHRALRIDRGGASPDVESLTRAACSTIAQPKPPATDMAPTESDN